MARAFGGMGRSIGALGAMGGLAYGAHRAGQALKSFNPQNPAMIGQQIAQAPQNIRDRNDDLNQVIDWATPKPRR